MWDAGSIREHVSWWGAMVDNSFLYSQDLQHQFSKTKFCFLLLLVCSDSKRTGFCHLKWFWNLVIPFLPKLNTSLWIKGSAVKLKCTSWVEISIQSARNSLQQRHTSLCFVLWLLCTALLSVWPVMLQGMGWKLNPCLICLTSEVKWKSTHGILHSLQPCISCVLLRSVYVQNALFGSEQTKFLVLT